MSWYDRLNPQNWSSPLDWGKKSDSEIRRMSTTADHHYVADVVGQGIAGAQNRPAPTAGYTQVGPAATGQAAQIATGPQDQFRGMQAQQANALLAQVLGQQKGPGELAAERMTARGIAAQGAMARSARGGNAGLMGLGAARNAVDIAGAGAGQAQQAALADKSQANALLSQALGQGRGQDIGLATSQAGFNQQMGMANMDAQNTMAQLQAQLNQGTSLANLQAQLQQTGMNDAQINNLLGQLLNMNISEMNAGVAAQGQNQGYLGGLLNTAGQVAGSYLSRPGQK